VKGGECEASTSIFVVYLGGMAMMAALGFSL